MVNELVIWTVPKARVKNMNEYGNWIVAVITGLVVDASTPTRHGGKRPSCGFFKRAIICPS